MVQVEFFFDYASPRDYLAFLRLRETAMRTAATIVWKPVDLAQLCAAVGEGAEPAIDPRPRRAAYAAADLQAWAHYCDIRLNLPGDWPRRLPRAMCGAVAAIRAGRIDAYTAQVFDAYYGRGEDVETPQVLSSLAAAAGLADGIVDSAQDDPAVARMISDNSDELARRGGFGLPTLFVGEQMFYGPERLSLVEFAIGQASERQFVMPGQHG